LQGANEGVFDDATLDKIRTNNNEYQYDGVNTCVPVGNPGDACGAMANSKVCGGVLRSYYQTSPELAEDLAQAISNSGEHPECPGTTVCSPHDYKLPLFPNVNFCIGSDNTARMNGMETCVDVSATSVVVNPLSGSDTQLNNALYNMFATQFYYTDCTDPSQRVSQDEAFSNQQSIIRTELVDADAQMDDLEAQLDTVDVAGRKTSLRNTVSGLSNLDQGLRDELLALLM